MLAGLTEELPKSPEEEAVQTDVALAAFAEAMLVLSSGVKLVTKIVMYSVT